MVQQKQQKHHTEFHIVVRTDTIERKDELVTEQVVQRFIEYLKNGISYETGVKRKTRKTLPPCVSFICGPDRGKINNKYHYHFHVVYATAMEQTTFRRNLVIAMKYEHFQVGCLKKTRRQSETYAVKGNCFSSLGYTPEEVKDIENAWIEPTKSNRKQSCVDAIKKLIVPCSVCNEWKTDFCKKDVARAVCLWYDQEYKFWDKYHMRKITNDIYAHRDENTREEFINDLCE